jgi:hypothetical protein
MKYLSLLIVSSLSLVEGLSASASSSNAKPTLTPEVDVEAAYAASSFPIAPNDLIIRAKEVMGPDLQIGMMDEGACLADDFVFCAAVVGPIPKKDYIGALATFKLEDSFDINPNFFGWNVDPMQTNRVWFTGRSVSKHTGTFAGVEATGKELIMPPQHFHLDFNEEGLVKEIGFYTVDRQQGNTGGLGGAFGYFYGVGKPLPIREGKPFKPSFRYKLVMLLGELGKKFQKKKE